jgi:peptide/nickel transport system substrate-binding protein
MRTVLVAGLLAASAALSPAPAQAQGSHLRIGLAEDPDVLDPTLARTYVGRIVFASLCDKLFRHRRETHLEPRSRCPTILGRRQRRSSIPPAAGG